MLLRFTSSNKANDHIYLPLLMEIRHSTVIVYVHENGILPFQGFLIPRNINMAPLRRILREPVFSGQSVLSRLLEGSRGCLRNTGLTVFSIM